MAARLLYRCHVAIPVLWLLAGSGAACADGWQKLRARGAEVYYADADLRAAFAETNPGVLPETSYKLPAASAPAFDWTKLIKQNHVLAQRDSTCCWGYAGLAAFEYSWAIRNGEAPPALAIQPILDRVGKDGNGMAEWAFQDLLEHGTCLTKVYPHVGKPGQAHNKVSMPYRAIAWGMVPPAGGIPEVKQIKQALLDHGPLACCVYYTPGFQAYRSGVYKERSPLPDALAVNHLVVIVGWDDRKGSAGCWKIQNSWGKQWGESGFMWLEYGSNNIGRSTRWVRANRSFTPCRMTFTFR
jgi:hypothetical protein